MNDTQIDELLRQADECERLAGLAATQDIRAVYRKRAEALRTLASATQTTLANHNRLASAGVPSSVTIAMVSPIAIGVEPMQIRFDPEIQWDGAVLSRWATINGRRVMLSLTWEMIHSIPIYNDAISWEVERHKFDIFERAKPQLLAQIS